MFDSIKPHVITISAKNYYNAKCLKNYDSIYLYASDTKNRFIPIKDQKNHIIISNKNLIISNKT